jgi:riboflavin synthase
MFTGIIESVGAIKDLAKEGDNIHLTVASDISPELKIDQSVSHNGVCLTVVDLGPGWHKVTAIRETLERSNLGQLIIGSAVNLERCLKIGGRLDGHIVQGHVDTTAVCKNVAERNGSWEFEFEHLTGKDFLTVKKGSITVNGVSLTVVDSSDTGFSVAIIPYTYEHTNFRGIKPGESVNIEFDVIAKYVARMLERGID